MDETRDTVLEVKEALENALEDREVFIHLNGEPKEVKLPETLAGNVNVTLKLSYYYRGPLTISDQLVSADLLFPEGPFTCEVPIHYIWGITRTTGESMFWPEHAPRQVLEEMIRGVASDVSEQETSGNSASEETPSDKKPAKATLSAVPAAAKKLEEEEVDTQEAKSAPKTKKEKAKKPPVLKRIK